MQLFRRKPIFAVRSPDRDRKTDKNRLSRLSELMAMFVDEIQSERDGLSKRYIQIERDAGFLLDALEADPGNSEKNHRLSEFESALVIYKRRIRTLGMQALELKYMQAEIAQRFDKIEKENSD